MSYIIAVAARWTKSVKFTLSIAVYRGGLAKNHFWLVATQKKRIGEQLNYFWNMCPKPFSWAKNKRKLFSVGKSRGPLLARVALKLSNHKILRPCLYLVDGRLCSLIQSANNHLLLPSVNECWNSKYALNSESLETLIQSLNKDSTF